MDTKDKLESLMSLAKLHRSQFDERRKYEWKVVFTALSSFVLTSAAHLKGELSILYVPNIETWLLGLSVITSLFLSFIHMANNINKKISEHAEDAIQDILNGKDITIDLFPGKRRWYSCSELRIWFRDGAWAWVWQTIMLLFFAIVASMIITG